MGIRTVITLVLVSSIALAANAQDADSSKASESKQQNSRDDGQQTKEEVNSPIRLESIFIGDKEQPAISYFIPWQEIGAPDQLHWNVEERYDEALEAVDREIMLRSMRLYGELDLEANAP